MALVDGLVAYWALEANGNDSHGANHLTNVGATFVVGKVGNAADLELSESDYLRRLTPILPAASDFTLSAWVKAESLSGNSAFAAQYIPVVGNGRVILREDTGVLSCFLGSDPTYGSTSLVSGALSAGVWAMATLTRSGGTFALYLNAGTPVTVSQPGRVVLQSSFTVGGFNTASGVDSPPNGSWWDGLVDEMFIASRAWSPAEIAWAYNFGAGRTYAEIVAGMPAGLPVIAHHWAEQFGTAVG